MTLEDEPTGAGPFIADFILSGAEDFMAALNGLTIDESDKWFWRSERDVIRQAVRLLRRCDDELSYRISGERVLHGQYFDRERITRALHDDHAHPPDPLEDIPLRPFTPCAADPLDHDEDPPESEYERYNREREA